MPTTSPEVRRRNSRAYYERNKELVKAKAKASNDAFRKINREYIWQYLSENPCIDCGESDPVVLEFDHKGDVEKVGHVSRLARDRTLDIVKAEIAKCDVRCANCHRRKTARQFGYYRHHIKG